MAVTSPFSPQSRAVLLQHDKTWLSKLIMRVILFVLTIIGIGLLAGAITQTQSFINAIFDSDTGSGTALGADDYSYPVYAAVWYFIPLGLSCIWVIVHTAVLLARRKPPPPGFAVAFDLILAIAFLIMAGALDTTAYFNLNSGFSAYNTYGDSSSTSSSYSSCTQNGQGDNSYLSSNCQQGIEAIPSGLSYTYTYSNGTSTTRQPGSVNYSCPGFDSCAASDAQTQLLNNAQSVQHQVAILGLVAAIFLSIAAVIHVILFIWACVDCHAYNRSATYDGRARVLATQMIDEMRARGELPGAGPQQMQQQQQPLLHQSTSYQGAGEGVAPAEVSAQNVSHPEMTHPAWRQNPGDIEGQYRDGPRLGNPLSAGPSYQALPKIHTSDDELHIAAASERYA